MIKLADIAHSKDNAFDFLRFMAASFVIISHSFKLYGLDEPRIIGYNSLGGVGVYIFFIISGYLVTKSWLGNPDLVAYFKKRILRIFPGIAISTLFTVFIIGALVTTYNFYDYFTNYSTWSYLGNMLLFSPQVHLPGVFLNNPYPIAVNGSIWTLPIEFTMYIVLAVIGIAGLFSKRLYMLIFVIALIYLDATYFTFHIRSETNIATVRFIIYFFIGSLFYLYRDWVNISIKICIFALLLLIVSSFTPYMTSVSFLALPYLVIYFSSLRWFNRFGKYGDFSYGLYIYAFPVQQTLIYLFKEGISFWGYFSIVFIVTFLLAVFSWHLIEKKALKLKYSTVYTPRLYKEDFSK